MMDWVPSLIWLGKASHSGERLIVIAPFDKSWKPIWCIHSPHFILLFFDSVMFFISLFLDFCGSFNFLFYALNTSQAHTQMLVPSLTPSARLTPFKTKSLWHEWKINMLHDNPEFSINRNWMKLRIFPSIIINLYWN